MSKSVVRWPAACLAVVLVAFAAPGCWNPFAPPGGGDPPPVKVSYKIRTTPENVIYNLYTAYKDMDADEYLDCLAEDFEFHLNPDDYGDPQNELPESWGKSQERLIHEAMFGENSDVERISLTLTEESSYLDPGEDPVDPSDDMWKYVELTDLRVLLPNDLTLLANADQEFWFMVDPNETGPEGETLWEIVDWWDLQETPYGRPAGEENGVEVSFGLLKAMYR